jgi:hypothetical protein
MTDLSAVPLPSMGRVVIYLHARGAVPATVRTAAGHVVSLTAHTATGCIPVQDSAYAPEDERVPGTWHWPART